MKKIFALFILLTLIFASCSGKTTEGVGETETKMPVVDNNPADIGNEIVEIDLFDWYSCWANWTDDVRVFSGILNLDKMSVSSVRHLPLYRIDSVESLEKFKTDYADVFSLDYNYDGIPCFNEKTASKDEAFFKEKVIFVVYMEATSGSFRYGARTVRIDGGALTLEVEQTNDPEAYTDDMSGWLVTVEILKTAVENCTSFDAVYNGMMRDGEFENYEFIEPPSLTVVSPYGEVEAIQSGAHWWGGEMGMIADSDYPHTDDFHDKVNYLPNAEFFGEDEVIGKLAFDFERQPDSIYMTRWRIGDEGNHSLHYDITVSITDGGITFPLNTTGCYVYSMNAKWEKVDNVGGSAQYYFCVGDREGYYDETCSPQLFIVGHMFELKAKKLSDGWTYPSQNGAENSQESLDVIEEYQLGNLPLISTDSYYGSDAKLIFDFEGEVKVTVRRWQMEAAQYIGLAAVAETVKVDDDMNIKLKMMDVYAYEVTAVWEMSDGVGGKIVYGFYTGPGQTQ